MSLVLAIIAFGIALIFLVRLSNQQNQELRREGHDRRYGSFGGLKGAFAGFFFGSLSKFEAATGKFLALAVIVFVIFVLGFVVFAVIKNAI